MTPPPATRSALIGERQEPYGTAVDRSSATLCPRSSRGPRCAGGAWRWAGQRAASRSAGRPAHRPAAEDVEVEVVDRLAGGLAHVGHHPEAAGDALVARHLVDGADQAGQQGGVVVGDHLEAGEVLGRDDQDVGRCLGVDVAEGDHPVAVEDDVGRQLALGDLAEQAVTVAHGAIPHPFILSASMPSLSARTPRTVTTWSTRLGPPAKRTLM